MGVSFCAACMTAWGKVSPYPSAFSACCLPGEQVFLARGVLCGYDPDMEKLRLSPSLSFIGSAAPCPEDRDGIPLYLSPVAAGFPSPADDYMEGRLDLHRHVVKNEAATFFLRAAGDSMVGAGIFDGDILVVDRSVEAAHNRIVIAALDGELTVKRLVRSQGRVYLAPENPEYPMFEITNREYVHIWGVVTYVVHKL